MKTGELWVKSQLVGATLFSFLIFSIRTSASELQSSILGIWGRVLTMEFSEKTGQFSPTKTNRFWITTDPVNDHYRIRVEYRLLTQLAEVEWVYDSLKLVEVAPKYVLEKMADGTSDLVRDRECPWWITIESGPEGVMPSIWSEQRILWLTYAFRPSFIGADEQRIIRRPISGSRYHPGYLYGWVWEVDWCKCRQFPARIVKRRDPSLDLDLKGELARKFARKVEGMKWWNEYLRDLQERQRIPAGFVIMDYECVEWYRTNGMCIPKRGVFRYWDPFAEKPKTNEAMVVVETESVELTTNMDLSGLDRYRPAVVYDYRYWRRRGDRIFHCAEYRLKAGEPLRGTNDAELLAQAERHLRRGRKYYEPPIERKHWVLWAALPVVILPPAVYMLWALHRRRAARIPS